MVVYDTQIKNGDYKMEERITIRLDTDSMDRVRAIKAETKRNVSGIVREALLQYLTAHSLPVENGPNVLCGKSG